ncbi:MAG: hypothetical protein J6R88_05215 [Clostridia bacterium]|nr:hypothetical protein [Clostridia bacterium]
MSYYEKTIIASYNALMPLCTQLETVIKQKAKNSYYNYSPCYNQANEILKLVEVRLDLLELKSLIDEALSKLSFEDSFLIKYKYLGVKPDFEFDHTSRNYFRKQVKAIEKFKKALVSIGVTEEWFTKRYLGIAYFKCLDKKIKNEEGKKHVIY